MSNVDPVSTSTAKKDGGQSHGGGKKKNKPKKNVAAASGDGHPGPSFVGQDTGSHETCGSKTETPTTRPTTAVDKPQDGAVGGKAEKSKKQQKSPKPQAENLKGDKVVGADGAGKPAGTGSEKPKAEGEQKSKAQLKAERRAVQEAQRAAKEAMKAGAGGGEAPKAGGGGAKKNTQETAPTKKATNESTKPAAQEKKGGDSAAKKKEKKSTKLDLQNWTEEEMWALTEKKMLRKSQKIDNSILHLGSQYFHHKIVGANARCVALLATLREVIARYHTPPDKEFSRDVEKNFLNPCIDHINKYCRPISTSMGNAIKHLKYHITQLERGLDDETAIAELQQVIDDFIHTIQKASEAIAVYAQSKIDNDDVIMVYAASSLIGQVLTTAFKEGKRFRVIVVEARPRTEGRTMLRHLVRCGIPCSYIYIGSAFHAMSEATKVFLGAAAMFAIGDMHSRVGNSMIATLAKANNIPVLVCCETYKFSDKVQLHSVNSNLHARGKDLINLGHRPPILSSQQDDPNLHLSNMMYDVTKSRYITAIITELGMLPCTSVPVVLRRQEDALQGDI